MKHNTTRLFALSAAAMLLSVPGFATPDDDSPGPGSIVIDCQGTVQPGRRWVFSASPGKVPMAVHVATGDCVTQGQTLVSLASGDAVARLAELRTRRQDVASAGDGFILANLELSLKRKQLENARAEATRREELARKVQDLVPSSTQRELRETLSRLEGEQQILAKNVALLRRKQAEQSTLLPLLDQAIEQAQATVDALELTAPFAGEVAFAEEHPAMLPMGARIAELWSDGDRIVRCQVLQHQLVHITPGCRATVTLDFSGRAPIEAVVSKAEIVPVMGARDSYPKFNIVLGFKNRCPDWLRAGMKVSARIFPAK